MPTILVKTESQFKTEHMHHTPLPSNGGQDEGSRSLAESDSENKNQDQNQKESDISQDDEDLAKENGSVIMGSCIINFNSLDFDLDPDRFDEPNQSKDESKSQNEKSENSKQSLSQKLDHGYSQDNDESEDNELGDSYFEQTKKLEIKINKQAMSSNNVISGIGKLTLIKIYSRIDI